MWEEGGREPGPGGGGPLLNLEGRFGFQSLGMGECFISKCFLVLFHWLVPPPFPGHEKTFHQEQRGDGSAGQPSPSPAVITFQPHVVCEVGSLFPFAAQDRRLRTET